MNKKQELLNKLENFNGKEVFVAFDFLGYKSVAYSVDSFHSVTELLSMIYGNPVEYVLKDMMHEQYNTDFCDFLDDLYNCCEAGYFTDAYIGTLDDLGGHNCEFSLQDLEKLARKEMWE